jgi:excisionase family DNA binding protein
LEPPKLRRVKDLNPNQVLLAIPQAALVLGVGENTLRRMIDDKRIPGVLVRGGTQRRLIRVSRQAIQAFIAREEAKSREKNP